MNSQDKEIETQLKDLKCMDIANDIAFIGVNRKINDSRVIQDIVDKGGIIVNNKLCQPDLVDEMH